MKTVIALIFSLALLMPASTLSQSGPAATYRVPTNATDGWTTANAETVGVDSKQFAALTKSIRSWPELGVHAQRWSNSRPRRRTRTCN